MMNALITSSKIPKVKIVIGKVRITKTGLTINFNSARTTAVINAVVNESTCAPGRRYARTSTAIAVNKIFKSVFIY